MSASACSRVPENAGVEPGSRSARTKPSPTRNASAKSAGPAFLLFLALSALALTSSIT